MSHFTKVKTVIQDHVILADALTELHYQFKIGETLPIRGYAGKVATGQVVVTTGCDYDIGFQRQENQSYDVCADWWGVQKGSTIRQEEFLNDVNRTYACLAIKKQVFEQGYIIEREAIKANGEIELVVCERF